MVEIGRHQSARNIQQQSAKMKRLILLACFTLLCSASDPDPVVNPRGARPVEPGTRSEKCDPQKDWPFCTDDDWGYKCPSGCRVHGLLEKYDHKLLKKIQEIRHLLEQNQAKNQNTNKVTKDTYDYLKEKLILDSGTDQRYHNLAQTLRQRITEIKIQIDRQLRILAALKNRVKDQVVDMQRLEVDIDIKLRACKGSCKVYSEFQVDMESYVVLDKQVNQFDNQAAQSIQSVGTLYVMKSQVVDKDQSAGSSIFKSLDVDGGAVGQQTPEVFNDVKALKLTLEAEGSISSPATVSKDPGTSHSSSTSSTFSTSPFSSSTTSSSSTSSGSITELSSGISNLFDFDGGIEAFNQPATTSIDSSKCTKTVKKIIIHTDHGPVEKVEEVIEGGPECQDVDFSKTGMGTIFPLGGQSSSTSSSSSTKTVHYSDTKGSITEDTKSGLGNPFDLGGFFSDAVEDDVPDAQARGTKSVRVERQVNYVGKDCVDVQQKHLNGETNGLFKIKPGGLNSTKVVEVYCQQEGLMGGWLLVQQRDGGTLSFNRTWVEYRDGFGSVDAQSNGEMWLGNQNIHLLTNQSETMLKVELKDWEGGVASAEYVISVGSEAEGFPLHVSGYIGDAGDALVEGIPKLASFLSHQNMKFSTFDNDNDNWEENCAEMYGGGWWYNNCQSANLNGMYYKGKYDPDTNTPYEIENGIVWVTYKPADYSLKTVRMLIRPTDF
ncbi:fibrinogen alpha chain [Thalassophryne amazonica]|uniref:fibrinogen alpha chain n=1 Tax=Thalassophryne amazonica TaxID=390379 RepID=UPI001472441E|nr:fibrinogen alpha chain [Thalassophryne amazonica]